jgi:hypothetical protein
MLHPEAYVEHKAAKAALLQSASKIEGETRKQTTERFTRAM